jgi:hypothetical protein
VVKRKAQARQTRRRRMLEQSRDCRESMTLSSRFPHLGQRIMWSRELTPLQLVVRTMARNFNALVEKNFVRDFFARFF